MYKKAKERMASAGFILRKWLKNDTEFREKIQRQEVNSNATAEKAVERLDETETFAQSTLQSPERSQTGTKGEKVLGLEWDPEQDTVQFYLSQVAERAEALEPTKRNVLSLLTSVFDPLGLISPTLVSIKVLFQSLVKSGADWDESLSGDNLRKFQKWKADLRNTSEIRIPRCVCV